MPVKREIMEKAVRQVLEEAKVPAQHHLRVIQLLHERMKEHQSDIKTWRKIASHYEQQLQNHDYENRHHEQQVNEYQEELERSRQIAKGDPGDPGDKGYTPQKGIDYFDGESPSIEEIVEAVKPHIPPPIKGDPGENAIFDEEAFTKKFLARVKKDGLLDLSHIKGAQGFIKDGVKYRFEELMHGGGGKSSSGSSPTIPSGIINGTNNTFTGSTTPTIVFTEGGTFTNGFGVTITGMTIVFAAGLSPQQWVYYI